MPFVTGVGVMVENATQSSALKPKSYNNVMAEVANKIFAAQGTQSTQRISFPSTHPTTNKQPTSTESTDSINF